MVILFCFFFFTKTNGNEVWDCDYVRDFLCSTTRWANSADDKLVIFIIFFPENRIWHFMQMETFAWNVKFCFLGKSKNNILICRLLYILPRVPSVNIVATCYQVDEVVSN